MIKNSTLFMFGLAVAGIILFSNKTFAQAQPKGKPWPVPEADAKKKNPMTSDANTLKTGKAVWNQHCASCHGKTGKGDGTKSAKLEVSPGDFSSDEYQNQTDADLYYKTTEGRKPMPGFKQKLSDSERWGVVLFTRTFKDEAKKN